MKVMIAGYGRMGQLIEQTLLAETDEAGRPVHEVVARIDIDADESRGIYKAGAEKASYIAGKTLRKVYKKVGFYQL